MCLMTGRIEWFKNCHVDFVMAIDIQATFVKLSICPTIQKLLGD